MKAKTLVLMAVLVFAGQASAVDLNSTTSLRYFPDNNLEFQVRPDGTIDTRGDIQLNGNNIDSSGSTIRLKDSTNDQDILRAQEGGRVVVPNGGLSVPNGQVSARQGDNTNNPDSGIRFEGSNTDYELSADESQNLAFRVRHGGSTNLGNIDFSVFDTGRVRIPNGNLDVSGNNITNIDSLKFEEGTSIEGDLSVDGSLDTSGDINLNDNNVLDADRVEANRIVDPEDGIITTNDNLDLESDGNLDNVNNIDVGSLTSNNGDGDIQLNQGFTVDGSAGGDGGVTLSGSGGLDINAVGGDNQQNSGDSLRLGGDINFDDGDANDPVLRTPGGGSGSIQIYDDANTQDIAEFQEGGDVKIPNGNVGIRTSANQENLNLKGSGDYSGIFIQDPTADSSFGGKVVYNDSGGSNRLSISVRNEGIDTEAIGVPRSGNNVQIPSGNLNLGQTDLNFGNDADITPASDGSLRVRSDGGGNNILFDVRDTGAGQNRFFVEEGGRVRVPDGNLDIDSNQLVGANGQLDFAGSDVSVSLDASSQGFLVEDTDGDDVIHANENGNNNVRIPNGNLRLPADGATATFGSPSNSNNIPLEVASGGATAGIRFQTESQGSEKIRYSVNGKFDITDGLAIRGELDTRGNRVVDTTGSDTVYVGDADSNTVRVDAGGSGDAVVSSGDGGSGSTERLRVTSSGSEADVDVLNSDVDLQGNSVTSSSGEVCIGDECA